MTFYELISQLNPEQIITILKFFQHTSIHTLNKSFWSFDLDTDKNYIVLYERVHLNFIVDMQHFIKL